MPRHQGCQLWRERATCWALQGQGWPKVALQVAGEPSGGPAAVFSLQAQHQLPPARSLSTLTSTAGLLPPARSARSASLLRGSLQGLRQHLPRMQAAGAPRRQWALARMGALGQPWVLLLTYLLTTLDLTSLFMQFSVLPVSTPPQGASLPYSPSSPICATAGAREGN